MKIAFFVGEFPALSETFILNQITGLIDLGYKVDIYAYEPRDDKKIHENVKKYRLDESCNYYNIPKKKSMKILSFFRAFTINFYKNPLGLLRTVNFFKYGSESLNLVLFYQALSLLNKDYDVLYCHFGPIGKNISILKECKVVRGKVVTTFHGSDISQYIKEHGESYYSSLFTNGDLFLPISNYFSKELTNLGAEKDKIKVHRMGIDTELFSLNLPEESVTDNIQVLTIGRLVEKKGIEFGIKAMIDIVKDYPNVYYTIIGEGPLQANLEKIIHEHKVDNKIKLVGAKSQKEITTYLSQTDIFLAPSVTSSTGDKEGIPVVIMEAMAKGIPVISSIHSGIPELVVHKETGFLAVEKDVNEIREYLVRLINDKDTRLNLGRNGSESVRNNFDIQKLNKELISKFELLLEGNN
ncbi:glycosyltransferase [Priestia megaterium]|uniref:glycosyltransferase n=1 Tax=Priestia megaterium TaxID=1404 RepID=UPI0028776AA8|nr:glycosyltransferase [Priestia megaterium]